MEDNWFYMNPATGSVATGKEWYDDMLNMEFPEMEFPESELQSLVRVEWQATGQYWKAVDDGL